MIGRYKIILAVIATVVSINCVAAPPVEIAKLGKIFGNFKVDGSFLIYDQNGNSFSGYNIERCNTAFCPASTFKIPNTLIAFETGVATPDKVFKWAGESRGFPSWEKDMTIAEAFKTSCMAVYQEIARSIGAERMKYYLRLFNYGDMDVSGSNIDSFWIEGGSVTTSFQQIYFLRQLYNLRLPVSEVSMKLTKEIMIMETTDIYKISWKTGWAGYPDENITWLVGYIEIPGNVYFFATNLVPKPDMDIKTFGEVRIKLTKEILRELEIIVEKQ